ncbi:cell envelope integrity EipB family protein [Pseudochrobactrum sp. HB0163]|uniref:cell envelope integrity EipB family protein n=1 Tax=Pseudochrobactrum sp. HB0163 TaxID=3450708 RepID=UPI003F6DED38
MRFLQALSFRSGFMSVAVFGVSAVSVALSVTVARAGSTLLPHRAVYDLTLERADEKSGINGVTGRMVYEFNGSACEGYTTNFRFVTRIDMEDQEQRITDQQATTFEAGDGSRFRFVNKTFVDKELVKEVRGNAVLTDKQTDVVLTKPEKKNLKLALSQFPTHHMEEMLRKIDAGETFYQTTLFDGSDDADKIMATTAVIGKGQTFPADDETKIMGEVAKQESWPVTVAYFDDEENVEGLPVYRINFKLYRNGVTRDLKMDYGDFAMKGTLVNLEMFKPSPDNAPCK